MSGERARPSRLVLGLMAAAAVYGLIGRWHDLTDIPRWQVGVYGLIARNYVKYGYADFGLAQIASPGPRLPRGERVQYQNHPPLAPLLSSFAVAAFGPKTWAVLLPHLLCGVGALIVLACFAARAADRRPPEGGTTNGGAAWAWALIVGAVAPMALRYGGAFVDPIGTPLILGCSLAALGYMRYCESGRRADYAMMAAGAVVGLLSDWPAYVLCVVLAGHALVYCSKARRAAMLVLPGAAVALFALFMGYARSLPREAHLLQSVGEAARGWLTTGDEEIGRVGAAAWAADFAAKFLIWFTPLILLAVPWVVRRARAAWTRENRREQHVLLLWLWPLPYVAAFPTIFYAHPYYHLLFLPAVVVTVAIVADGLCGGGAARKAITIAGFVFLVMCSFYALTQEDRWEPLRRRQVRWAADIAAHTAPDEEVAFALHYAQQMRFVADRRVVEKVDTVEKVAELGRRAPPRWPVLFAPLAYPFGKSDLAPALLKSSGVQLCGSLVRLSAAVATSDGPGPPAWGTGGDGSIGRVELSGGVALERALFGWHGGVAYIGAALSGLPKVAPGGNLEWGVRFADGTGAELARAVMPAQADASYLLATPRGWETASAPVRIELVLRLRTTDAAAVGRVTRLTRLALRFLTFRVLGNPKPRVREFLLDGKSPIVLSVH